LIKSKKQSDLNTPQHQCRQCKLIGCSKLISWIFWIWKNW